MLIVPFYYINFAYFWILDFQHKNIYLYIKAFVFILLRTMLTLIFPKMSGFHFHFKFLNI